MTGWIDREDFAKWLEEMQIKHPKKADAFGVAKIHLRHVPAADVKPVVHGRWIEYPDCLKYPNAYADDHIVCSVCEECFSVLDNDTERFWFCPHCGADMREG